MEDNQNADLLAELNGAAEVVAVDAKEIEEGKAEVKKNPLDVSKEMPGAEKTSAAKALEKTIKASGKPLRGYAITVEGEYYEASKEIRGKNARAEYSVVVTLPSLEGALSVIKNKLLDKMLKMRYPGYVSFRTHKIAKVVPLTNDLPDSDDLQYMSEEKLKSFITFKKVPVNPVDYPVLSDLRDAVIDYVLNPKGFEAREAKRKADREETNELLAMNNMGNPGGDSAVRG